jgi:hypothetical protein
MQKIFTKKCFLFTAGSGCPSILSAKKPPWWQTFRWWWRGWNGGATVAETTAKRLEYCAFRRTGKAMGRVYQCWWWLCREIMFAPGSNITCVAFCIHLWATYWLSLVYRSKKFAYYPQIYAYISQAVSSHQAGWPMSPYVFTSRFRVRYQSLVLMITNLQGYSS